MAFPLINTTYTQATSILSNATASAAGNKTVDAQSASPAASNKGSVTTAIQKALVQINSGRDITGFLSSESAQQSSANFADNLFATLPGFGSRGDVQNAAQSATQAARPTPIILDPESSSFRLQSHIQKLITQLDSTNPSDDDSGLGNLQSTFNTLIKSSGGEPSAKNLQSFLKLVAVNIAGSTSIGSLFRNIGVRPYI